MVAYRANVLIVDDEEAIRESLRDFLESAIPGVKALVAEDGPTALAILRSQPVDLIMADYKMPGMDGMQLLSKAATYWPDVPRIMMTAFPDLDLAIVSLNDGHLSHFFTKPIEPPMVRDVVRALLDERIARQKRQAALARSLEQMRQRDPPKAK